MDNSLLAVQKLFVNETKSVKFLENYYAKVLNLPELKISLSYHADTSYCDLISKEVVISAKNLKTLIFEDSRISFKMFYTLLLHEIGHAIYTSDKFGYSEILNILEDNRLEFQISMWNKAVRFDIIRYALFDKVLAGVKNLNQIANSPTSIGLALLRSVDNRYFVDFFSQTEENAKRVKRILQLDMEFTMEDAKANMDKKVVAKLERITEEVTRLLLELSNEQIPPPPPTKQGGTEPTQSGSDKNNKTDKPSKEDPKEKQKQDLEEELKEIQRENEEIKQDAMNGIGKLLNQNPKLDDYKPLDISAFQVARTMGMRGTGTQSRSSGNANQLSLRKYMRKDFDRGVKPFEKPTDVFSIGGKTTSVSFYLDISGSMSGTNIELSTRYLKSFYDTMSKHMYIRFFGFGRNTYEFTRNELELDFISNNLEGATYINFVDAIKPNEQVIILTDGSIHGDIPRDYREKATFIVVGHSLDTREMKDVLIKNKGVKSENIICVENQNIQEGLDRATAFIKKVLQ
jgi:hypothetical protein